MNNYTVLAEKDNITIIENIITFVIEMIINIFLINKINGSKIGLIIILVYNILILINIYKIIYWLIQPKILLYQYETGIIINNTIKIEYTNINKAYYKSNKILKRVGFTRKPVLISDDYVGTIYIKTKTNTLYKIKNVFYPIDIIDKLSKIKKQKKFR